MLLRKGGLIIYLTDYGLWLGVIFTNTKALEKNSQDQKVVRISLRPIGPLFLGPQYLSDYVRQIDSSTFKYLKTGL